MVRSDDELRQALRAWQLQPAPLRALTIRELTKAKLLLERELRAQRSSMHQLPHTIRAAIDALTALSALQQKGLR